ncbi:unnamed protein product, partial [Amoebophrya sp. A25]
SGSSEYTWSSGSDSSGSSCVYESASSGEGLGGSKGAESFSSSARGSSYSYSVVDPSRSSSGAPTSSEEEEAEREVGDAPVQQSSLSPLGDDAQDGNQPPSQVFSDEVVPSE